MRTRTRVAATLAGLAVATTLIVVSAGPAAAYDFPSTNDANRAADLPHVDLVSTGPGTVTLEFVNTRRVVAFFEYRIDGQTVGTTPHPVVTGDVIHPGFCIDGRPTPTAGCTNSLVQTFEADATVEVRLALGGERDWDFDWTSFAVGPKLECGEPGTDRFSVGDASVVEGDSGDARKLRIPVTISNPTTSTISVDYTVESGSATFPDDFDAKVDEARTLTFKPSAATGVTPTTKFVTVKVVPDTAVEGDEDLTVTLGNPTGGYTVGRDTGTGTILDDDDTSGQAVAISGASACEGDTSAKDNRIGYQVSLRDPATTETAVTVTVAGGTATSGVDYKAMPKPKTLKFKVGQVQKAVTLTVFADLVVEPDEDVLATITGSSVPVLGSAASADAVILDDDDSGISVPI
jgi:hypothetical protein